jgi:nucleoside-diphosphate-sugar epimerase
MTNSVFIIGSNGYVGTKLSSYLSQNFDKVIKLSRKNGDVFFDLNNFNSFNFDLFKHNDTVIFLSAESSPDTCSNYFKESFSLNVINTINFIEQVLSKRVKFIFASSDVVYGNTNTPVNELAPLIPIGDYALMKYSVERFFSSSINFLSIRLSNIFSLDDKFIRYLDECENKNIRSSIYNQYSRNTIYYKDVLLGIKILINNFSSVNCSAVNFGGPNCINKEVINNYYVTTFKKNRLNYTFTNPSSDFFKNRALNINLDSSLLESLLGKKLTPINEAMDIEFKNQRSV